jgi:N-acetylmuramoyl-L-alanine amidase
VVKGDSLGRIGSKYGVSIDALKKANGLKSDTVVLGSKLRIP